MNKLIVLAAAAVGALLFSKRKTLKEDSQRLAADAKDRAANLNERMRGGCAADEIDGDDTVVDLTEEVVEQGAASAEESPADAT